jgi:c-di-GMP phosphodiesterase Gmr
MGMEIGSPLEFAKAMPLIRSAADGLSFAHPNMQAQFAWLSSLPIAAAVCRQDANMIERIASNKQFDSLVVNNEREHGIDPSTFASRIMALVEHDRDSHFECWQSKDPVSLRELEINIARFGDSRDLFLITLLDRTAEAKSRQSLRREMLSDSLTGFWNRTGFEEEIESAIKSLSALNKNSGSTSHYAIILIDLARFSRINESVGALAGDELIITVARRLNARIRSNEILCRMGGNEFAVFVNLNSDKTPVEPIAQRLMEAFAHPCNLSDLEIQMECAVAAATGDVESDDPTETLRQAQIALKRAKSSKRFELYSAGGLETVKHRFSIETDLRYALQRGELELYYQPLVDLDTGVLSGFEALARWQHADHGFVSPVEFIPVAEECGLIVPLGRWALEEAARTVAEWDKRAGRELPVKVSVNMSAIQLQRDDVPEAVAGALKAARISGERLTIELTESAFLADPDGGKRTLEALKALNTNLAMDDFGTGYSNLAYLQQLPIDVLKIDRSFVTDMLADKDKRAIVRTILSLARALGMKTTAEGIETLETSSVLKRLGCSIGQGYYFARPLTAEAAYDFLSSNSALATS